MSETTHEATVTPEGRDSAHEEEYVLVKSWHKKWISPVVDTFLYVLTGVAVIALALHLMVAFFGFSMYSFNSGSMEPTITTGSVSLAKDVDDPSTIEVGDILTVTHPTQNIPLTHRVIKVNDEESIQQAIDESIIYGIVDGERDFLHKLTRGAFGESTESETPVNVSEEDIEAGNLVVINMQGDANDNEDPRVYAVGPDSADTYVGHVPAAGNVLDWVSGNFWWLLVGMGAVLLYVIYPFDNYKKVKKSEVEKTTASG